MYAARMARQRVARVADLGEGVTVKFEYLQDGVGREGFAARIGGRIVAYENVCRHLPLTLDFGDNHIFTRDRRFFACQSHGAVYEPLTGLCVHGPCKGASLKPLAFAVEDGELWIDVPAEIA
jgi:nitrite reductase/ring-hydroxylating ferredoxin subunit